MLAIFGKSIVQAPEQLIKCTQGGTEEELMRSFKDSYDEPVIVRCAQSAVIAYTHEKQALLKPRTFAVADDIFCVFEGILENLTALKQQYGLSKVTNEVLIVIEAYRNLRDRAPYPTDHMIREWRGHFAFTLFDKTAGKILVATDSQEKIPLYWGVTSEGSLTLCDDLDVLKNARFEAPSIFPPGCFLTEEGRLQSFDHPLNEVKASPRGSGNEQWGVKFEVEYEEQQPTGPWAAAF